MFTFPETTQWRAGSGEEPAYPGADTHGDPDEIPARIIEGSVQVTEDYEAQRTVQVPPEYAVDLGDLLDGHEVERTAKAKDVDGVVLALICYTAG